MRLKNNKGISPLIATVLLIGFTVVLGALLYLWLSGTVSLQAKKGELQCGPDDIAELQFSVPSCEVANNELKLRINNQGSKKIDGFWVAMRDSTTNSGITPLDVHNIKPGSEDDLGYNLQGSLAGATSLNVELIPVIIEDSNVKTCASNSVKVECTGGA